MSKSDAAMKRQLDSIGDPGNLKRRRFIGGSNQDQQLWKDGGLTFGVNGIPYGSCDFGWYTKENWVDPYDNKSYDIKPQLVVEATDALNTRSFGDAQIQRLHHGLGSFRCNVDTVYWLRSVEESETLQEYVPGAAYFLTKYYQSRGYTASYLVTTNLEDIRNLTESLGNNGVNSEDYQNKKNTILEHMHDEFFEFLENKYDGDWMKYLRSEEIIQTSQNQWVKLMGARKQNWLDSSKRGGHIYVSKTIASKYLLIGSGLFNSENDVLNILWPLMPRSDYNEIERSKSNDKEWRILTQIENENIRIATNDDLTELSGTLRGIFVDLQTANLNRQKGKRNLFFKEIINGLQNGTIFLN